MNMSAMTSPMQAPAQNWVLHKSADRSVQLDELTRELVRQLRAAVAERGRALLAVSGGKSPIDLYARLRREPLPWAQVTVLLVDERCVPPDHADSNAGLVRRHLLQDAASVAHWLPFFDHLAASDTPEGLSDHALATLVDTAEARLSRLDWPLDIALLGMGEDGHTASLFPHAAGLQEAIEGARRVAWTRPATAPHARLTLTLPTLLAARALILPLQGATKRAVFEQACLAPTANAPISLVLHHASRPVQVWLAP